MVSVPTGRKRPAGGQQPEPPVFKNGAAQESKKNRDLVPRGDGKKGKKG